MKALKDGYEAFFLDSSYGYDKFYKFRYLPVFEDFKRFLNGDPPLNAKLFLSERVRNKFWEWFNSDYLRNNIYPIL